MFICNHEREIEDLGNGVTRKMLAYGGDRMAVEVHFAQNTAGPLHNYPHKQLTDVLSGVFQFTNGDETLIVKARGTL